MKYKLLGIKSLSGYSSCPNCKEVGAYLYKGNGGSTCFPALLDEESNLIVAEPRTVDMFETGINGQVNVPLLVSLNNIGDKLFECTAIDQLHGVFGGNVKALINKIVFSTSVHSVLRQKTLEHSNSFMRSITPPSFMERGIRLLTDYKLWKGHECIINGEKTFSQIHLRTVLRITSRGTTNRRLIYTNEYIHNPIPKTLYGTPKTSKQELIDERLTRMSKPVPRIEQGRQ